MISETLHVDAEFGKLPFDIFVLGRWDFAKPTQLDQRQWDELAREWLALDARGRHPYHELSRWDPKQPTAAQVTRVLLPYQTVRERNLSLATELGRYAPVWLRTCYSSDLAGLYADWSMDLDAILGGQSTILDDEGIYTFKEWSQVLLRAPAIADTVRYHYEIDASMQDERVEPPGPDEQFKWPVYESKCKEKTMLFLIDEQALREGLIKILWLDVHGQCVWENRLEPDRLLEFWGRMHDGGSLLDLYEEYEDPRMYQSGALLPIGC